jgi:hypothetical protein
MTAPTITLADVGTVPALPDDLIPIALAVRDVAAHTWSVVACPDGGQPVVHATGLANSVAAGRIAARLTVVYGPAVFTVHRCPSTVTVHGAHPELAHNLIGTIAMPVGEPTILVPADLAALADHVRELADHVRELAAGLHAYAVTAHRREYTHRVCPTCGSRVRLIRANVVEAMGNPCNNGWHDQI